MNAAPEAWCVRLPAAALSFLADLRARQDVCVRLEGNTAWVWWLAGDREVLHRVLAGGGAELFERRDGRWYRPGRRLPSFEVPDDAGARPLLGLVSPMGVTPQAVVGVVRPVPLELVREDRPRPARALLCPLADLAAWAEQATSRQLAGLEAALDDAGRVLVLGERLPPLAAGERYWGRLLLLPLGWRAEPDLGEAALAEAVGLRQGDIGLLSAAGVEVVDRQACRPLTRAGVRLAVRQS
jgi:hypothetical protein